jgi:hypothetical protein
MGDFAGLQVGLYKLFGRELLVAPNAGQCSHCTVHFEDRLGASFLVQAIDGLDWAWPGRSQLPADASRRRIALGGNEKRLTRRPRRGRNASIIHYQENGNREYLKELRCRHQSAQQPSVLSAKWLRPVECLDRISGLTPSVSQLIYPMSDTVNNFGRHSVKLLGSGSIRL